MDSMIWVDEAGNKAYEKYVASRGVYQFYVKNAKGELVNKKETKKFLERYVMGFDSRKARWI